MEKRTVVKRIELGEGVVHVVLHKQLAEPCEVTTTDDEGESHTETGERLLVDEPHRVAIYPWRDDKPAKEQIPLDDQIAVIGTQLATLGYPPIPADGVAKIKRLLAAL